MQTVNFFRNIFSGSVTKFILVIVALFSLTGLFVSTSYAINEVGGGGGEGAPADQFKDCPGPIQDYIKSNPSVVKQRGTFIIGYDASGKPIYMTCNSGKTIWGKWAAKIIFILSSFAGILFSFSAAKSAFLIAAAGDNAEQFQTAIGGLKTALLAVLGVTFAYSILVFIVVGVLGAGGAKTYNIICQNQLVFQYTFGDATNPETPSACLTQV